MWERAAARLARRGGGECDHEAAPHLDRLRDPTSPRKREGELVPAPITGKCKWARSFGKGPNIAVDISASRAAAD
jgi:hypothetical protein